MKLREEHYISAAIFLVVFIAYRLTMAMTVSFWDCGEFISCSYILGVPHPPGAPLYLLIGRIFSILPFASSIAFRVNIISVFCSAGTVVLLYLSIVLFIRAWRDKQLEENDINNKIIVHASGIIGALTFAFTDTFWFNGVEAEVYAVSMFLSSLVLWLALKWMEDYEDHKSTRFLIFGVYLFGLATGVHLLNLLLIPAILFLIVITDRRLLLNFNIWALVPILIFVGFSTYLVIYIRSGLNPLIDENNPENWVNFMKYIRREQYGVDPGMTLFDRRAPFWDYQINKMYIRYFGWNFIGKGIELGPDNYIKNNISFNGLLGLPFLLGLIGMVYHFIKDKMKAIVNLIIFFFTGVAIVIYLNQPDPQPRERDYVFVGSFYAFAVWVGISVVALWDWLKPYMEKLKVSPTVLVTGIVAITFVFGPVNQFIHNKFEHNRSHRFIDYDYSYNLLQSCEQNAILFTNGDNDTFPLWYLQTVEKIRTDVKVVNLSLLNTPWYIKQLKNQMNVPVGYSNQQIDGIGVMQWNEKKTLQLPVPEDFRNKYSEELLKQGHTTNEVPEKMPIDIEPTFMDRYIRVQDIMILNIIAANRWKLPVSFAVTVPNSNMVGLREYMRMDGLAYKVLPIKNPPLKTDFLENNLYNKFKFRDLDNPGVFLDYQTQGLVQNLRSAFLSLALAKYLKGNKEAAATVLDEMGDRMPEDAFAIRNNQALYQIGLMYKEAGRPDQLKKRLDYLMKQETNVNNKMEYAHQYRYAVGDTATSYKILKDIVTEQPNNVQALGLLLRFCREDSNYTDAIPLLENWVSTHPADSAARNMLTEFRNSAGK